MKKIFFAILIGAVVVAGIILGVSLGKNSDYVEKSAEATFETRWKETLAHYINEQGITIYVDGIEQEKQIAQECYMNDDLELMMSQDAVREAFDCAVDFYYGNELHIDRGTYEVQVKTDAKYMHVNGKTYSVNSKLEISDKVYIPSEIISKGIGYSFNWNGEKFECQINNDHPERAYLPRYYNYAEKGKINFVGNQGEQGTCWAFAAISALESSILPERTRTYSKDHLIHNNGFGISIEKGGDRSMAIGYFTSWKGPVNEADDPYDDGVSNPDLTAVDHVQEIRLIESKDYENIKKMILKYGAVETSVYFALLDQYTIDSKYYNEDLYSYCYPENILPNHEIIIIGWDDDYPAENFNTGATNNGAFICQNSWGSKFGDSGIFYVSYDDAIIGTNSEVYTRVEDADNYDNIYQYDMCGYIGKIGFDKNHAFFSNVYTAKADQYLKAVSFYATGPNTTYKIYLDTKVEAKTNGSSSSKFHLKNVIAEGKFIDAGYYTVNLNQAYELQKGKDFAIIVEIDTPSSSHPIAIEMKTELMPNAEVVFDGKRSYISDNGRDWEYTQKESECNVCLKAFTDNK